MKKDKIITGLDLGSSKITVAVGEVEKDGATNIVDVAVSESKGIDNGTIVDLQAAVSSVEQAVEKAEQVCGRSIYSVFVNVSGTHVQANRSRGFVSIVENEIEITKKEVDLAVQNAKNVSVPLDGQVLHVLPISFSVDGQPGIKNPIGMYGSRLEADIAVVSSAKNNIQNITKCLRGAGLEVEGVVLSPIATAAAILTNEEKQAATVLVDIGGKLTDILVYNNGAVEKIKILQTGGDYMTKSLMDHLKIPFYNAKEIKERFAVFPVDSVPEGEKVILKASSGQKTVPRRELCQILEEDAKHIFSQIKDELKDSKVLNSPDCAIVLTGAGSMLDGLVEMAEGYFSVPARLGYVRGATGSLNILTNPAFATSIGLVRYGAETYKENKTPRILGNSLFSRVANRLRDVYEEYF